MSFRLALGGALLAHRAWSWRGDADDAARFRAALSASPPPLPEHETVSVLVAAWNEAGTIERHMESIQACDYSNVEHVMCAGGADGTFERARALARSGTIVIEQAAGEGKQRALRRAYQHATGSIIYLCDADCLLSSAALRHLLAPLLLEGEPGATGTSIPFRGQLDSSASVRLQHAVKLFGDAHTSRYASALFGRNAVVRREALDRAGAFSADVPTGTDYHLGKALIRSGARIRHVPASRVTTRYAERWRARARQQRRWLRNVVLHGRSVGAWDEVAASLRTSVVGTAMLAGPAAALIAASRSGQAAALLCDGWLLALALSVQGKLRYLRFARAVDDVPPVSLPEVAWLTLAEFAAWGAPLLDYPNAARRRTW